MPPKRYQIILDCSHSMSREWADGQTRFEGAREFILPLMQQAYQIDSTTEFALRVLGRQYPMSQRNCLDSKQEVYFSRNNYEQMTMRLSSLSPFGVSSIAYAIKEAPKSIDFKDGLQYALILITDAGESCNGNFCHALQQISKAYSNLPVYILQFNQVKSSELDCAENYFHISERKQIGEAITEILGDMKRFVQSPLPADLLYSSGFGFIKIKNVFQASILGLSYISGQNYIPFTQLSLTNTTAKHKIRIKAGKYKIDYRDLRHNVKAAEFEIKVNDTTEIELK